MKTTIIAIFALLLLVLPAVPARADWDADVTALLDALLENDRQSDPLGSTTIGDRRFDRLWPDASPEGIAKSRQETNHFAAVARSLRDSMPQSPNPDRLIDLELAEFTLSLALSAAKFDTHQFPISQQSGPFVSYPQLPSRFTFTTRTHYSDYLHRLRTLPVHLEDLEANLRAGLAAGRTPPRVVLRDVPAQAQAVAADPFLTDPESHPMFAPFASDDAPADLRAEATTVMRDTVVPAWQRFARFVGTEYIPHCRESIAASDLPGGPAYYATQVARYSTLDMTADEIHTLGLAEVARIRAEMFNIIKETGFANDHPELEADDLFAAFTTHLRTDPRFYHSTPEDLLRHYRDVCKRMDAQLPELFGRLPRLPYGVKPLPDYIAPSAPTAYYYPGSMKTGLAGNFMANTHNLTERPKYEAIALALHEAVPGHHLQGALAQELEELGQHKWRTNLYFTAFGEGWGLYSERLGLEVGSDHPRGLYADPYDEFGRLSYEMWRAMRLVVDTGMHAKGWSRNQAIEFMNNNSALSEANIVSEVDRYIAWPGQALGYKIGEIFIRDLRARAESQLGDNFNIRAFHDHILAAGAVTLPILERRVTEWIETQN